MSNVISNDIRGQILELLANKTPIRQISRQLEISRETVRRVIADENGESLDRAERLLFMIESYEINKRDWTVKVEYSEPFLAYEQKALLRCVRHQRGDDDYKGRRLLFWFVPDKHWEVFIDFRPVAEQNWEPVIDINKKGLSTEKVTRTRKLARGGKAPKKYSTTGEKELEEENAIDDFFGEEERQIKR